MAGEGIGSSRARTSRVACLGYTACNEGCRPPVGWLAAVARTGHHAVHVLNAHTVRFSQSRLIPTLDIDSACKFGPDAQDSDCGRQVEKIVTKQFSADLQCCLGQLLQHPQHHHHKL